MTTSKVNHQLQGKSHKSTTPHHCQPSLLLVNEHCESNTAPSAFSGGGSSSDTATPIVCEGELCVIRASVAER